MKNNKLVKKIGIILLAGLMLTGCGKNNHKSKEDVEFEKELKKIEQTIEEESKKEKENNAKSEEVKIKETIDPFEGVTLEYSGAAPYCLNIKAKTNDAKNSISKYVINFDVKQDKHVTNGDTVTMTIRNPEDAEKSGYELSCTSKDFVIENAPMAITDYNEITDEEKEVLFEESKKYIEKALSHKYYEYIKSDDFNKSMVSAPEDATYSDMIPVKGYAVFPTDTSLSFGSLNLMDSNHILIGFEMTATDNEFHPDGYTTVMYCDFSQLFRETDGTLTYNYNYVTSGTTDEEVFEHYKLESPTANYNIVPFDL